MRLRPVRGHEGHSLVDAQVRMHFRWATTLPTAVDGILRKQGSPGTDMVRHMSCVCHIPSHRPYTVSIDTQCMHYSYVCGTILIQEVQFHRHIRSCGMPLAEAAAPCTCMSLIPPWQYTSPYCNTHTCMRTHTHTHHTIHMVARPLQYVHTHTHGTAQTHTSISQHIASRVLCTAPLHILTAHCCVWQCCAVHGAAHACVQHLGA